MFRSIYIEEKQLLSQNASTCISRETLCHASDSVNFLYWTLRFAGSAVGYIRLRRRLCHNDSAATSTMAPHVVWQGVDALAFYENAILLDVRFRSQGIPIRSAISCNDQVQADKDLSPQLIRNVLDDLALVLSGHGGKDNVSAICMEDDTESHVTILRLSSNDGVGEQKLADFEGLLKLVTGTDEIGLRRSGIVLEILKVLTLRGDSDVEVRREKVLANILQQCSDRFFKHVTRFSNELKQVECPSDTSLRHPAFDLQDDTTESLNDLERLGPYTCHSHKAYMELSCERLCRLRSICFDLSTSRSQSKAPQMIRLARLAYNVRRSSSFNRLMRHIFL